MGWFGSVNQLCYYRSYLHCI